MCSSNPAPPPPPPPAPPPVLEQVAPKSEGGADAQKRRRQGLRRYRIGEGETQQPRTVSLGGIPTRSATGS